jgi:hypothetical protein
MEAGGSRGIPEEGLVVRSADQIQKAHDLLTIILRGSVGSPNSEQRERIETAATVLCWVLEHHHNDKFGEYLKQLESVIRGHRPEGKAVEPDAAPASSRPMI